MLPRPSLSIISLKSRGLFCGLISFSKKLYNSASDSFDARGSYGSRREDNGSRDNYGETQSKYDTQERFSRKNSKKDQFNAGENLSSVCWNEEKLVPLTKDFYQESAHVKSLSTSEVDSWLGNSSVTLTGQKPLPKHITLFDQLDLPSVISDELRNQGITTPSVIQSIGLPAALSGRDLIAIAQTGSGKTLAYLLPSLLHARAQPPLRSGDGPIVLVMTPTRELSVQVYQQACIYGKLVNLHSTAVYGGVGRYSQAADLKRGVEVCVATPGRLLDFLDSGTTCLKRVTYLVLDEADRMLDMGFEPQMRKIVSQIRPDRQTLFWSATWPREIQSLARDFCVSDPVKILVGSQELRANPDVTQEFRICREFEKRKILFEWLKSNTKISDGDNGKILIFCESRKGADALARDLKYNQFSALSLHGDKEQKERDRILSDFKSGTIGILVATDVAQRGLDIKGVDWVVNFDMPKTVEDYVHRIGRTGRAGKKGTSITFFDNSESTPGKTDFATELCKIIKDAKQTPPMELVKFSETRRRVRSSEYY